MLKLLKRKNVLEAVAEEEMIVVVVEVKKEEVVEDAMKVVVVQTEEKEVVDVHAHACEVHLPACCSRSRSPPQSANGSRHSKLNKRFNNGPRRN